MSWRYQHFKWLIKVASHSSSAACNEGTPDLPHYWAVTSCWPNKKEPQKFRYFLGRNRAAQATPDHLVPQIHKLLRIMPRESTVNHYTEMTYR